ncbi:MAG: hypothetical protein PHT59_08065, partial [Candidatus Omnitrophica bacterium]|nr:hypothetical protein [Candidatus Omnitrophota bacterium]
ITIKDRNELKVVLKSGHHGYFKSLDEYGDKQGELEAELAKLQALKQALSPAASSRDLEDYLDQARLLRRSHGDRGARLDGIAKSLDSEEGDDDSSKDDEPEVDGAWAERQRGVVERSREEVQAAKRECDEASEALDRAPPKKHDDEYDRKKKDLKDLSTLLAELDQAMAGIIARLDEIKEKIEKLRNQPPSFLIIEIIGKGCDSTQPSITNLLPADGSLLNSARPPISAQYADDGAGSGIDPLSAQLTVDSVNVTAQAAVTASGVTYTPGANLAEGGHQATLTVSDKAHNTASASWRFTTDTVAPVAKITSHQNNQYLNTPQVTVSGTIDDPSAALTVNGRQVQNAGGAFSLDLGLTEGSNSILVEALDQAGNRGSAAVSVIVDTVKPVLSVSTLSDNASTNQQILNIAGSATDTSGLQGLMINGSTVAVNNDGSFSHAVTLAPGPNTIIVVATDAAGNTTT